jgi:hypothetical protein
MSTDTSARRPGRRRALRLELDPTTYAELTRAADRVGLTPEQLAVVWLVDRLDEVGTRRRLLEAEERTEPAAASVRGSGNGRRASAAKSTALHEEIATVLGEHGKPMTVAEIAGEIRRRGNYLAPRAKRPITPGMVSRRVSNPHYRSMFERSGRTLSLADQPGARSRSRKE